MSTAPPPPHAHTQVARVQSWQVSWWPLEERQPRHQEVLHSSSSSEPEPSVSLPICLTCQCYHCFLHTYPGQQRLWSPCVTVAQRPTTQTSMGRGSLLNGPLEQMALVATSSKVTKVMTESTWERIDCNSCCCLPKGNTVSTKKEDLVAILDYYNIQVYCNVLCVCVCGLCVCMVCVSLWHVCVYGVCDQLSLS